MATPPNSHSRSRRFAAGQARLLFQKVLENDSDQQQSADERSDDHDDSDYLCSNSSDSDCATNVNTNNSDSSSSCKVSHYKNNYLRGTSNNKGKKRKQAALNDIDADGIDGSRDKMARILPGATRGPSHINNDNSDITSSSWHEVLEGEVKPKFDFRHQRFHVKPDLYQLKTPTDYLKVFFDDETINCLVKNINDYAEIVLQRNNPSMKHSRTSVSSWTPFSKWEWLKFTSVIIAMGLDPKPSIKDYWCTTSHFYTPWYATMMSRNRFQTIYHTMLHVCEPDAEGANKIEPFIEILLKKFQTAFYSFENVSINEMVIGWRGRFQHKKYSAKKPHKYHIKAFGLSDSVTGYVVNLKIYYGKNTIYNKDIDLSSSHAVKVFGTLLRVLGPGHHIFADSFYTSKALINFLRASNFNYTGTLNVSQVGFSPEVKHLQLRHQETKWFIEGDETLCVAWKDKRAKNPCFVVSTKAAVEIVKIGKKKLVTKPKMIHDYNISMKGCDRMEQMISCYNIHDRKTVMWWKKIYYWIFEIAQVNAHILHTICQTQNGGKEMSLKEFKMSLIDGANLEIAQLIPESATNYQPRLYTKSFAGNYLEKVTGAKHLIDYDGKSRDCVFCCTPARRRRSSYVCSGCTNRPHLCAKVCFAAYHK